ncbi:PA1136 family autoinducer-binding transcriptional regulator [[Pseudomonas] boreopolis]|uniref:PA1136 family autoinducer-binding transcriptional regulator n=1 Tax=Xanthomonas boreopolis TaxID=86183 RepID=UPI003D9AEA05
MPWPRLDHRMDALSSALAIERCRRMSDIHERVRTTGHQWGYDRFVLYSASGLDEGAVEQIYWVDGDWLGTGEAVDMETYIRHCPVTRHVAAATEPFFWTKVWRSNGERYRITASPRGEGIHGIQVPVFGPAGLEGAMSAGGERIDASPGARFGMELVALAAFRTTRKLLAPGEVAERKVTLSKREKEVLSLIAGGRRQSDVAATLALSERTVENHLRRIRARLGVATTAQAVTVAIRNGIIGQ